MYETQESTRNDQTREAYDHSEGRIARTLENQTAKIPSDFWLWAAIGSMGISLFLQLTERKHASLFVAQWAAPFLLFGTYNKLVKQQGFDRLHH